MRTEGIACTSLREGHFGRGPDTQGAFARGCLVGARPKEATNGRQHTHTPGCGECRGRVQGARKCERWGGTMSVVHELGPTQFETDDDASESVITIPAAYLEDVRAALVAEIKSTSESLALDQVALLSASGDRAELCAADRDNALRLLRKDVEALDELRQAHGETRLAADAGNVLAFLLEAMVRLLAERL